MSEKNENFNVTMIQNHEPGWEEEWGRITSLLAFGDAQNKDDLENPQACGILYSRCKKIATRSAMENCWEDFASYVLLYMQERVEKQTLFSNFDPEQGGVSQFLCSRVWLEKCFKNFQKKEKAERCGAIYWTDCCGDNQEGCADENIPGREELSPEQKETNEVSERLQDEIFQNLVIRAPRRGSRIWQQAGLQLFPRLNREDADMALLREDLCREVSEALRISESAAQRELDETHRSAQKRWKNKILKCTFCLKEDKFKMNSKRESCAKHRDEAVFRHYFCPIGVPEIMRLLLLAENNASQCMKRYRNELSELLGNYLSRYEEIFDSQYTL